MAAALVETCSCGAEMRAADRSIVMLGFRQSDFHRAHRDCRLAPEPEPDETEGQDLGWLTRRARRTNRRPS